MGQFSIPDDSGIIINNRKNFILQTINFDKLMLLLHKPSLWQRNTEPFWDDDHISKGMLHAHLNPVWDAASRKHETIDHSVDWLSTIISTGSKILDIGCGPGLYTKRLSDRGYDVTGIDFSKRSIKYAQEHDSKTKYIYGNYLDIDYNNDFDVITLIYCDYGALTLPERKILLSKVFKALKPNGLFILDVFTNAHFKKKSDKTSWTFCENSGFWSDKPHICLEATHLYESSTVSVEQNIVITSEGMNEYLIWDTAYSKESLRDEVLEAGFTIKEVFDDISGNPYTCKSETLCAILERKA